MGTDRARPLTGDNQSNPDSQEQILIIPEKLKARLYPVAMGLFAKNDFHQVNIRTISERSGVSTGTIYKYFSSKEDLLFSMLEEHTNEIARLFNLHVQGLRSSKEILRKALWAAMDYYDRNPDVAVAAFITVPMRTWMKQNAFRNEASWRNLPRGIDAARAWGDMDPGIDPRRYRDIYYMICYRCIHTWFYHGMKWRLVDAMARDFDIWWKMLAPPPKEQR